MQIKYTRDWLNILSQQDYTISGQNISALIDNIKANSVLKDGAYYATIRMDSFPQPGPFKYDRNQARVYQVPDGCEVLSYKDEKWSYEPITQITVEDNCAVSELYIGGRLVVPSTNESMAVFNHDDGTLKRVTPVESTNWMVPYIKKDPVVYGTYGTFDDGWFLGAILSDGYLNEGYFGYAKKDDYVRNHVIDYLTDRFPGTRVNIYEEQPGPHKLGSAIKCHFTGADVREFVAKLDLYQPGLHHDALSKRISDRYLREGSEDFLWGILSGILDGDGTIVYERTGIGLAFTVHLCTSSPYFRDSLVSLCYRLGLRVTVTTTPSRVQKQGHVSKEAYTLAVNSEDLQNNLHKLGCYGDRESMMLTIWADNIKEYKSAKDCIPLTYEEKAVLCDVARRIGDRIMAGTLRDRSIIGYARYRLMPLVKYVKDPHLRERITNTNICWVKPKFTGRNSSEVVYDFEVPTTKVFAVNDGVVVYDTASSNGILSKQANEEVAKYLDSVGRYVSSNGKLTHMPTNLIDFTLFNLSRDPSMK